MISPSGTMSGNSGKMGENDYKRMRGFDKIWHITSTPHSVDVACGRWNRPPRRGRCPQVGMIAPPGTMSPRSGDDTPSGDGMLRDGVDIGFIDDHPGPQIPQNARGTGDEGLAGTRRVVDVARGTVELPAAKNAHC